MLHLAEDGIWFGNISGGRLDGLAAITIEFGLHRDIRVEDLLATINGFGRTYFLRFAGDLHHQPVEDMTTLTAVLREQGKVLSSETKGTERYPWMDSIPYRVAILAERSWLMYRAEEIRFTVTEKPALPELADIHSQSYLYAVPGRDTAQSVVLDVLREHPFVRLYSPRFTTHYRYPISLVTEE